MLSSKWKTRLCTLGMLGAGLTLTAGCLDRPVVPADPDTSNVFVDQVIQSSIDKIDLLFTIDNSASMADKQELLGKAVPALLSRLITPMCVDKAGALVDADAAGGCPLGYVREFQPVNDIHIGVVTSSLGGHGGDSCVNTDKSTLDDRNDDRGQLLGSVRPNLQSYQNLGFLAWGGAGGLTNAQELIDEFSTHVKAVRDDGCGYEATLEAWYRFLIDPEPPLKVEFQAGVGSTPTGINDVLLQQRAAFLRPDSLVAIVMLSDENDCSIQDEGQGYLIASDKKPGGEDFVMPHATSECENNPNDRCCRSCRSTGSVDGCPAPDLDPACQTPSSFDQRPLRCHDQKRRFGIDLLYPISRYVNALKDREVPGRDKSLKPNPLFVNPNGEPRDPSLVFLAGIVGVPWQDLATDASRATSGALEYMTAKELTERKIWDVIVGDPANNLRPTDPFMLEQSSPRMGTNPITGDTIMGVAETNPRANPINGHEFNAYNPVEPPTLPVYDELQYACTYQLATPIDCLANPGQSCDCEQAKTSRNKPLCNPLAGGPADTVQRFGKAMPGLRELEVLKGHATSSKNANSIVASICPKVPVGDSADPNFGYNPAIRALVDRLKVALRGRCLPRALELDAEGFVPCVVVEAVKNGDCNKPGRVPIGEVVRSAVEKQLVETATCSDDCGEYTLCEILPAGKAADGSVSIDRRDACAMGTNPPGETGYCYIDEAKGIGNPDFVARCDAAERRQLHFIGDDTPRKGAPTFIACVGESVEE